MRPATVEEMLLAQAERGTSTYCIIREAMLTLSGEQIMEAMDRLLSGNATALEIAQQLFPAIATNTELAMFWLRRLIAPTSAVKEMLKLMAASEAALLHGTGSQDPIGLLGPSSASTG